MAPWASQVGGWLSLQGLGWAWSGLLGRQAACQGRCCICDGCSALPLICGILGVTGTQLHAAPVHLQLQPACLPCFAERANCFATMRSLAREVTGLWLTRREEQVRACVSIFQHVFGWTQKPSLQYLIATS